MEKIDLLHTQNIKVDFKTYISETYTVTYCNDAYQPIGYVTSALQNIFSYLNFNEAFNPIIHSETLKSQINCNVFTEFLYHFHINFKFTSCTNISANEQNRMLMSHTFSCSNMHALIIYVNCNIEHQSDWCINNSQHQSALITLLLLRATHT